MGSNPAFLLQKRVIYNTKTTDRYFLPPSCLTMWETSPNHMGRLNYNWSIHYFVIGNSLKKRQPCRSIHFPFFSNDQMKVESWNRLTQNFEMRRKNELEDKKPEIPVELNRLLSLDAGELHNWADSIWAAFVAQWLRTRLQFNWCWVWCLAFSVSFSFSSFHLQHDNHKKGCCQ